MRFSEGAAKPGHSVMKHFLPMTAILLISTLPIRADIKLNVGEVTQTKAHLTAEQSKDQVLPVIQYKYGELIERSDFANLALNEVSDPVELVQNEYPWNPRSVKGWVESYKDLPVGKDSKMSVAVNLSETTSIKWQWSVDSEENVGILYFAVDGKVCKQISGYVEFTDESYRVEAGEHTVSWYYSKKSATNVGLDLGMVRNIEFQNTTPGKWLSEDKEWGECTIENLYPGQKYLCRAVTGIQEVVTESGETNIQVYDYSAVKQFETLPISVGKLSANPITQATAKISGTTDFGDAIVNAQLKVLSAEKAIDKSQTYSGNEDFKKALAADISDTNFFNFNNDNKFGFYHTDYYVYSLLSGPSVTHRMNILFSLIASAEVSFEYNLYSTNSDSTLDIYIDDKKHSLFKTSDSDYKTNFTKYTITLPAGKHTIEFTTTNKNDRYGEYDVYIRNLTFGNCQDLILGETIIDKPNSFSHTFHDLKPGHKYIAQMYVSPNYESPLENRWGIMTSESMDFTTLPIVAQASGTENLMQASVTINGKYTNGDASIIAKGLQYRDATGNRWTDYPTGINADIFSQKLTRLKPSTKYVYRAYIQAEGCDTVFSPTSEFTTLAVRALKPELIKATMRTAQIEGKVVFGDANIYQRGFQYRKKTYNNIGEWIEIEDGGEDATYSVKLTDLDINTAYEARTYIQPAGSDIIYSDVLEFQTNHPISNGSFRVTHRTQTTITVECILDEELPGNVPVKIHYSPSDDHFLEAETINTGERILSAKIIGLLPYTDYKNGQYFIRASCTIQGNEYSQWLSQEHTLPIEVKINATDITQTKAKISVTFDAGDAVIENAKCNDIPFIPGETIQLSGLRPDSGQSVNVNFTVNGLGLSDNWIPTVVTIPYNYDYQFNTRDVSQYINYINATQTSAVIEWNYSCGDATFVSSKMSINGKEYDYSEQPVRVTELAPNTAYRATVNLVTKEGGSKTLSRDFKTASILTTTDEPTNISNRSATLNGTIDCDTYSSAVFGFEWKKMIGWNSDPAFTKGTKADDGTIALGLANGMLEPDTDYQYRTCVRYLGASYYGAWKDFRTELEYVFYPGTVYTIFRTDRINNRIVFCGYYVAGSEEIKSCGYEYWNAGRSAVRGNAPGADNVVRVVTDNSMVYELPSDKLADGTYCVRAFITSESGTTYGQTLSFGIENGVPSSIDEISTDLPSCVTTPFGVIISNAENMSVIVFDVLGRKVAERHDISGREEIDLTAGAIYYVVLSDGSSYKVRI